MLDYDSQQSRDTACTCVHHNIPRKQQYYSLMLPSSEKSCPHCISNMIFQIASNIYISKNMVFLGVSLRLCVITRPEIFCYLNCIYPSNTTLQSLVNRVGVTNNHCEWCSDHNTIPRSLSHYFLEYSDHYTQQK